MVLYSYPYMENVGQYSNFTSKEFTFPLENISFLKKIYLFILQRE